MDTQLGIETTIRPAFAERSRKLNRCPHAIDSAVRRIVHDYMDGWGIVLNQSVNERRRKKRIKNRRAVERQTFNCPVWVHKAEWAWDSSRSQPLLHVLHDDESLLDGMFLVHDLSNTGMGLICDRTPKSRLIVLEFDSWKGQPIEIALYLRWRRRLSLQDYRCGGSILGELTPE